jgi:hypothetical protein
MAGFFGGCFPILHDLITRQKVDKSKKINLDFEFFFVKGFLIPLGALVMTALATAFGNITTGLAALYLGASLPILVEKALSSGASTVAGLGKSQ